MAVMRGGGCARARTGPLGPLAQAMSEGMDIAALLDPFGVPCLGSYSGPIWDPFGAHFGSYLGALMWGDVG